MITGRMLTWLPAVGLATLIPAFVGAWWLIPLLLLGGALFALTAYADAHFTRIREEAELDAAEAARWERLDGAYRIDVEPVEDDRPSVWRRAGVWIGDLLAFIGLYVMLPFEAAWDAVASGLTVVGAALAPAWTYGGIHRVLNEETTELETVVDEPTAVVELVPAKPGDTPGQVEPDDARPQPVDVDEPTTGTSIVFPRDEPDRPHDDWQFDTVEMNMRLDAWCAEETANVRA